MKRIDEVFENTISEYNKHASDINKFQFTEFEKIVFKNMMADYADECIKASLEKASENAEIEKDYGVPYVVYHSVVSKENIVLL